MSNSAIRIDYSILGSSGITTVTQVNHGFSVGQWLYRASGFYALTSAATESTSIVVGIVDYVKDADVFTIVSSGKVSSFLGLSDGSTYFLGIEPGTISVDIPTTVGSVIYPILVADSETSGFILNSSYHVLTDFDIANEPFFILKDKGVVLPIQPRNIDFGANMIISTVGNTTTVDSVADALGSPPVDGYILSSSASGVRSWIKMSGGHVLKNSDGTVLTQRDILKLAGPLIFSDSIDTTVLSVTAHNTLSSFNIENAYTKTEVDTALSEKLSPATTLAGYGITDAYTKTDIDGKFTYLTAGAPLALDTLKEIADAIIADQANLTAFFTALSLKADKSAVYTKTEIDAALAGKISPATTLAGYGIIDAYTKTQVDTSLALKATKATTLTGYGITDAYTKTEIDANKASKATTVAGYGITDAFTKTEVNTALALKENSLGTPANDGYVLASTKLNARYWKAESQAGHEIDGNLAAFPQRAKLNFTGNIIATDDPANNATTIQIGDVVQGGTVTWTSNADFNTTGAVFASGMDSPATGNQLGLKVTVGEVQDSYNDQSLINSTLSSNVTTISGNLVVGSAIADFGNGADGDFTIGSTINLTGNTQVTSDGKNKYRAYCSAVLSLLPNQAIINTNAVLDGWEVGEELLLLNVQGSTTLAPNVGVFEFVRIAAISSSGGTNNVVTFTSNKTKFYGDAVDTDFNIGIAATNQKVILQRVPNFNNLTITTAGAINVSGWNGTTNGIICFRVSGTFTNNGSVSAASAGYRFRGAASPPYGEGIYGQSCIDYTGGGGSAGGSSVSGGAGAGHAGWGSNGPASQAGAPYGDPDLKTLTFGAASAQGSSPATGGAGGGIVAIYASTFIFNGSVKSSGGGLYYPIDTRAFSGGAAGGSILIKASSITSGTCYFDCSGGRGCGGYGNYGQSGDGSCGYVVVQYQSFSGATIGTATQFNLNTIGASVATPKYVMVGTYATAATAVSTNLLSGKVSTTVTSFVSNVVQYPAGVTITAQFSQDNINWTSEYAIPYGINTINLGWGSNGQFYYKYNIINLGISTPQIDYSKVVFAPSTYSTLDQQWTSAAFRIAASVFIKPKSFTANWSLVSGNAYPKFQLIGSSTAAFTAGTYTVYPSATTYYQQGVSSITSGGTENLFGKISDYYEYWKMVVVLNCGSTAITSPYLLDLSMTYDVYTVRRIIDAAVNYTLDINRGTKAALPASLGQGELYITTDTTELYVGLPSGNKKIADVSGQLRDITQATHGFTVGTWVYRGSGAYYKAQANALGTANAIGVVTAVISTSIFTLRTGGYVTGLSGLVDGADYYISPTTAGAITNVVPSTSGQVVKKVMTADGSTSGYMLTIDSKLL
jgi:hypothetical protein